MDNEMEISILYDKKSICLSVRVNVFRNHNKKK